MQKKIRALRSLPALTKPLLVGAALIFSPLSYLSAVAEESILFLGNSFTFGYGSATRYYRDRPK